MKTGEKLYTQQEMEDRENEALTRGFEEGFRGAFQLIILLKLSWDSPNIEFYLKNSDKPATI